MYQLSRLDVNVLCVTSGVQVYEEHTSYLILQSRIICVYKVYQFFIKKIQNILLMFKNETIY